MGQFEHHISDVIDAELGQRCTSNGFQYSEIVRSLVQVYFCGGSCIEDISNHLLRHLQLHPKLRTCSSYTILRCIKELSCPNRTYVSEIGNSYNFNTAERLNQLLLSVLLHTGQLKKGYAYDLDFDHQFIETEKYDAQMTYKHFRGYGSGIATIGNLIVGIENRDGNTNVRFHQQDTLRRIFSNLSAKGIRIERARMDCGTYAKEIIEKIERNCKYFYIRANRCAALYNQINTLQEWMHEEINFVDYEVTSIPFERWESRNYRLVVQGNKRTDNQLDLWEGAYTYRCILTNDFTSTPREIIEYYNLRGETERILDEMNNGFEWKHLPKSFMAENTVFLLLTALVYNFYKMLIECINAKAFGVKKDKQNEDLRLQIHQRSRQMD